VRFVVAILSLGVACGIRAGAMPIAHAALPAGLLPAYADCDPGTLGETSSADPELMPASPQHPSMMSMPTSARE